MAMHAGFEQERPNAERDEKNADASLVTDVVPEIGVDARPRSEAQPTYAERAAQVAERVRAEAPKDAIRLAHAEHLPLLPIIGSANRFLGIGIMRKLADLPEDGPQGKMRKYWSSLDERAFGPTPAFEGTLRAIKAEEIPLPPAHQTLLEEIQGKMPRLDALYDSLGQQARERIKQADAPPQKPGLLDRIFRRAAPPAPEPLDPEWRRFLMSLALSLDPKDEAMLNKIAFKIYAAAAIDTSTERMNALRGELDAYIERYVAETKRIQHMLANGPQAFRSGGTRSPFH